MEKPLKQTVFIPVSVDVHPDEWDFYDTDLGELYFEGGIWFTSKNIDPDRQAYCDKAYPNTWYLKQEDKYILSESQLEEVWNSCQKANNWKWLGGEERGDEQPPLSFQEYIKK